MQLSLFWFIVFALAVWRVTHLLAAEDGPGGVLSRLRAAAGGGFWESLLGCFYCLSLWVALPFAWLLGAGTAATLAFVILRGIDVYGDPFKWTAQRSTLFTALSFLNTTKYPPSLLFLLMTLGPVLLFLRAVDQKTPTFLQPAIVYGRVPMFYFLLHFFLIHVLAIVVCAARYGAVHWMFESPSLDRYPFTPPPGWGFSLPTIYLCWALVVASTYLPSRWFGALKRRRSERWLSYL